MNRIELETLMKTPSDTLVPWGDHGKVITVAEALKRVFQGEGMDVIPVPPAAAKPGQAVGPNLRISQEAVNALTEQQYKELSETGHLQGLTNSDKGRAVVRVTQGGSYTANLSFDPEGGKAIGPGRPLDTRDFHDPASEPAPRVVTYSDRRK
jgi:hypothetical protein